MSEESTGEGRDRSDNISVEANLTEIISKTQEMIEKNKRLSEEAIQIISEAEEAERSLTHWQQAVKYLSPNQKLVMKDLDMIYTERGEVNIDIHFISERAIALGMSILEYEKGLDSILRLKRRTQT